MVGACRPFLALCQAPRAHDHLILVPAEAPGTSGHEGWGGGYSQNLRIACARAIALNPGILWFIMVVMELSRDQGGLSWVRCRAVLTFCADLQMHKIGAARALHVLPKAQPRATQKNPKAQSELKNLEPRRQDETKMCQDEAKIGPM